MSVLLIVLGVWMIYWSWGVITHVDEAKVNQRFRSWLSEKLNEEDAESYRVVNAVLFAFFVLLFGIILSILGFANLFN